jgi:hypothetical protein
VLLGIYPSTLPLTLKPYKKRQIKTITFSAKKIQDKQEQKGFTFPSRYPISPPICINSQVPLRAAVRFIMSSIVDENPTPICINSKLIVKLLNSIKIMSNRLLILEVFTTHQALNDNHTLINYCEDISNLNNTSLVIHKKHTTCTTIKHERENALPLQ